MNIANSYSSWYFCKRQDALTRRKTVYLKQGEEQWDKWGAKWFSFTTEALQWQSHPPLPVTRDTRDSILGIKGKLKVVLSHLEFYLIRAARQIQKNSLRVDSTGKLIKSWLNIDSYCKKLDCFLLPITIV